MGSRPVLSFAAYAQLKEDADKAAQIVAIIVLVISLVAANVGWAIALKYPAPAGSVTVTSTTTPGPVQTVSTKTDATATVPAPGTKTVTTTSVGEAKSTKTTTIPTPDNSLVGYVLRNPGVGEILCILLALLAAFLSGAAVQRIKMGEYGITIAGLILPSLPAPVTPAAWPRQVREARLPHQLAPRIEALREDAPVPQLTAVQLAGSSHDLEALIRQAAQGVNIDASGEASSILFALAASQKIDADTASRCQRVLTIGARLALGADITPEATALFTQDLDEADKALRKVI